MKNTFVDKNGVVWSIKTYKHVIILNNGSEDLVYIINNSSGHKELTRKIKELQTKTKEK